MLAETGELRYIFTILQNEARASPGASWQSPRNEGDHHDDGTLTTKGELMATPAGGGE
ncbi:MAG: hypothetical protein WA366_28590 [Pseudolabrys sp.]